MNRIEAKFKELKKARKKALVLYLTAGYPNLATTEKLVPELERAGADIIELGVPFSDPVADGVTIQRTSAAALASGTNLSKIFRTVSRIRGKSQVPIILMGYYNPILSYGLKNFIAECKKTGVDGLICADLPPDEAQELLRLTRKAEIGLIFLLAPTSTPERIKMVSRVSYPFIYYVSVTGVTGVRKLLPNDIRAKITQIRRCTKKPVCLGFGVSNASQAKEVLPFVDGVIVGSALLDCIEKAGINYLDAAKKFTASLSAVKNID
ncbi:MAG: tryptophan synthase subunit alpha [Candidatus Ratteibacteria bacterium]|jgi:tryptophan synthase alpha chain